MPRPDPQPAPEPVSRPVQLPEPAQPDVYEIHFEPDRTLVRLAGEVDAAMTDLMEMAQTAIDARTPVEVDITDVQFMDSVGCGFLARLIVGTKPSRVRVLGTSPHIRLLLQRLQLDTLLDLDDDQAVADPSAGVRLGEAGAVEEGERVEAVREVFAAHQIAKAAQTARPARTASADGTARAPGDVDPWAEPSRPRGGER